MAHQQATASAANGQPPGTTAARPQAANPTATAPPAAAARTDEPAIDPALILGTQEVTLFGPFPPPPHITLAPGHLLWSLDGLNWVAATCPDHFFQQVAAFGDVQVRARPLDADPDADDASSANQVRPPPWALACLLVWALLVAQPRPSAAPAVVALTPPTRAQAARWAYRRVAYRMWRAMQSASQPTPIPPAVPDRISRLEQNLDRAQHTLDQLRSSTNRHTAALRSLATGIQHQVASATAAPSVPPGLTAALSTAQSLLSRLHPT